MVQLLGLYAVDSIFRAPSETPGAVARAQLFHRRESAAALRGWNSLLFGMLMLCCQVPIVWASMINT